MSCPGDPNAGLFVAQLDLSPEQLRTHLTLVVSDRRSQARCSVGVHQVLQARCNLACKEATASEQRSAAVRSPDRARLWSVAAKPPAALREYSGAPHASAARGVSTAEKTAATRWAGLWSRLKLSGQCATANLALTSSAPFCHTMLARPARPQFSYASGVGAKAIARQEWSCASCIWNADADSTASVKSATSHARPQSGSHGRRATATTILAAVEAARPRRDRSVGRPRIPQARAADFNDGGVASHRRAGRLQGIGGEGYSSGAVFSSSIYRSICFARRVSWSIW